MRIYNGPKPCAGCGRPGSEVSRYAVDAICHNCRDLIELGKGVRANSDGFSTIALYPHGFKRLRYTETIDGKEVAHRTEDFRYVSDSSGQKEGSSKDLINSFADMLKEMHEGKKSSQDIRIWMDDAFGSNHFTLRTSVAKKMFVFLDAMAKWGKRVEEESYARGKNLLFGLASGEMTVKEFNDKA